MNLNFKMNAKKAKVEVACYSINIYHFSHQHQKVFEGALTDKPNTSVAYEIIFIFSPHQLTYG
jgi:hypothetical protein